MQKVRNIVGQQDDRENGGGIGEVGETEVAGAEVFDGSLDVVDQ